MKYHVAEDIYGNARHLVIDDDMGGYVVEDLTPIEKSDPIGKLVVTHEVEEQIARSAPAALLRRAAKKDKKVKPATKAPKQKGACGNCGEVGHSKWHCPKLGRGGSGENGSAGKVGLCWCGRNYGHTGMHKRRQEDAAPAQSTAPKLREGKLTFDEFRAEVNRRAHAGEKPTQVAIALKERPKMVARVWPRDVPMGGSVEE